MAQSLKDKFQICFMDDRDPSKGFKYIYLTQGKQIRLVLPIN
jgi:hypothetical protein